MSLIHTIMRAIEIRAPGEPEMLQPAKRETPRPGAGQVLIRVAAAGVNRPDVMQRQGKYPPPPGVTDIPGLEVAGTIVAVGPEAPGWREGDRVVALVPGGGYAEYCLAPAGSCLAIPGNLTMVEAASLPETVFTVWSNLFDRARFKAGETVLIHGGTSGIGVAAIQMLKAFDGNVFVTCGSDEKCAAAEGLGADMAINYGSQDFVAVIEGATGGRGVDIVLDMVGGDYVPRNLKCLSEDGRHISIAIQRGNKAEIAIFPIMQKRLTLTGSTLRARPDAVKALIANGVRGQIWPRVAEGRIRPVVHHVLPLEEAATAHRLMEEGQVIGKIVLKVDG